MGIGHVRYPTAGSSSAQEAQPFFVNSPLGMYLIHNGNLTNTAHLRAGLEGSQSFFNRHLRTDSDSEVQDAAARALVAAPSTLKGFLIDMPLSTSFVSMCLADYCIRGHPKTYAAAVLLCTVWPCTGDAGSIAAVSAGVRGVRLGVGYLCSITPCRAESLGVMGEVTLSGEACHRAGAAECFGGRGAPRAPALHARRLLRPPA